MKNATYFYWFCYPKFVNVKSGKQLHCCPIIQLKMLTHEDTPLQNILPLIKTTVKLFFFSLKKRNCILLHLQEFKVSHLALNDITLNKV